MAKTTRVNRTDLTLRNLHALKYQVAVLRGQLAKLTKRVALLEAARV